MAQQISIFCSKTKLQQPTVEFEQAQGSQDPSCTCKVTLHACFDAANDVGFPEMTFQETARTKKASKGAAMTKAHAFLAGTVAFKKVMAAQSPWVCLEKMLLTTNIAILSDVRSHVVAAVTALNGWIPLAALMNNSHMQKSCKKLGKTTVEQLDALAKELLSSSPPAGLQLSSDGYCVKVAFKDEEEQHSRLNPGFVVDGHGSPAQALQVVCDIQGPNSHVQCVLIPVDVSQPLASRDLPPCKYYRQSLAEAMGAPLEGMVRVGTLQGATREASLEAALKKHEISNAEKAATVQGGSPAKRARCSNNTVSRGHENAMENKSGKASLSPAATAEKQCKRDASGEAMEQPTFGMHAALKDQIRLGDCYAVASSPHALLNVRASFLVGMPVYGAMLCTRVRLMAAPPNDNPPLYGGLPVTVQPVMRVLWDTMSVEDMWQSAVGRWPCKPRGTSLIQTMPRYYDEAGWSGNKPSQVLASLLAMLPGSTSTGQTSHTATAAHTEIQTTNIQAAAKDVKNCSHTVNVTVQGMNVIGQAQQEASEAAAEQAAALDAVHKLEALVAEKFVGRDVSSDVFPEAVSGTPLQWESPGVGTTLPQGSVVKAEVCVTVVVQGRSVEVEKCCIKGRLGTKSWVPVLEEALQQMKPGATVRLHARLPFLGHDPTGLLSRCPVEIRIKAAVKQPCLAGTPTVFTPSLSSQRHALALQIVKEHGCHRVVDFGCGEGSWIKTLMFDPEQSTVTSVLGVDESPAALQRGSKLIPSAQLKCKQQVELQGKPLPSVKLCQGSVTAGDLLEQEGWGSWHGCDAAIACEVVEHVHDPDAFAQSLFGGLRPGVAFVSTPNMEYNKVIRFCVPNQQDPCKPIGSDGYAMRDRDHKFEWSRSQFQDWCQQHAQRYSYSVSFAGVGECSDHAQWLAQAPEGGMDVGMATQVAVFKRADGGAQATPAGNLKATVVYELAEQTEEELAACMREYMQLRKQMFNEARNMADASEGAESLLASLNDCVLNDDDTVD